LSSKTPSPPSSQLVRLEPIGQPQARAILAGEPQPGLPWEEGFPTAPLLNFLAKVVNDETLIGPFFAYVIVRSSDGRAVGDAGFHGPPSPAGEVEVGYALVPGARGAGLARDAVKLLVEWAREQPGVEAVVARVDEANEFLERSEGLLLSLGFLRDGAHDGMRRFVLRRGPDARRETPAD
jgi:RimJ/RimL family protein N-acetyltransferase